MTELVPAAAAGLRVTDQVADLLSDWRAALLLRVAAGELAANSAASYQRGAQKFIDWGQAQGLRQMDAETLRSWKASLLADGKKPATVNAWLSGVKSLFTWAVEKRRLPHNPTEGVKGASRKGASKKHVRESLTDLEVRRVLAQPDVRTPIGKRDRAILSLMAYTAVRSVEVHRADLADLKTEGGHLVLYVRGKGHIEADELVVIADPGAQDALYDWLAVRGDQAGPLFLSYSDRSQGERLSLRMLRHLVKSHFRAAGVRGNKTTHSLRHTAITKVIMKSGSIQKAQSVARHRSVDTTMIYFHELDRLANPGEAFIDYGSSPT